MGGCCSDLAGARPAALVAANGGADRLTPLVGQRPQHPHTSFSHAGVARAVAFVPRPSDVFLVTAPKTGTTLLQFLCHCLRVKERDPEAACLAFDDIYQVAPWAQMAWDLGQSLDDGAQDALGGVRLFKTHQRISAINRGARYIAVIRRPAATAISWYNFLKEKDVPPLRKYWAEDGGGAF